MDEEKKPVEEVEEVKKVPFFKTPLFRNILKVALGFVAGIATGAAVGFSIGKNNVGAVGEVTYEPIEEPVADVIAE